MGRVWLARDLRLHRDVAVKELVTPPRADPERAELRRSALREAQAAAQLNHPNAIRIFDIVDAATWPWIVLEYVPSWSLADLTAANGPLPPAYVAKIGVAVLDALTAAHRVGVLHRDVKPANILIGHDGRVVLADFGIATWRGHHHPADTHVLGTPQYVPPERTIDGRSLPEGDLWALGAALYYAVEGRGPYARDCVDDILIAVATGPPDPFRHAGRLGPVLHCLLQREPRHRPSIARTRQALDHIAGAARSRCSTRPAAGGAAAPPVRPGRPSRDAGARPSILKDRWPVLTGRAA